MAAILQFANTAINVLLLLLLLLLLLETQSRSATKKQNVKTHELFTRKDSCTLEVHW